MDLFLPIKENRDFRGLDGVELHGCHSYLICQFLNKNINRREDIYGQKEETFVLEILRGIRGRTARSLRTSFQAVSATSPSAMILIISTDPRI